MGSCGVEVRTVKCLMDDNEISHGAIWGSESYQMTYELGKVHMGSCGVEFRTDGCSIDDSESWHGVRWGHMG